MFILAYTVAGTVKLHPIVHHRLTLKDGSRLAVVVSVAFAGV
jgi:hypothetical protein